MPCEMNNFLPLLLSALQTCTQDSPLLIFDNYGKGKHKYRNFRICPHIVWKLLSIQNTFLAWRWTLLKPSISSQIKLISQRRCQFLEKNSSHTSILRLLTDWIRRNHIRTNKWWQSSQVSEKNRHKNAKALELSRWNWQFRSQKSNQMPSRVVDFFHIDW